MIDSYRLILSKDDKDLIYNQLSGLKDKFKSELDGLKNYDNIKKTVDKVERINELQTKVLNAELIRS